MRLRELNSAGVEEFRDFLRQCREEPSTPVPSQLLESDTHTTVVPKEIEVEPQIFVTKRDAAEYFHEKLAPIPSREIKENAGLWTWLTLQNFDAICPLHDGERKVRNDYTYIFEPRNMRHFYRHLLFMSWRLLDLSPTHNRLFLNSKAYQRDSFSTEVVKRLYLTRIPCIFEVLDRLYWDEERGLPRKGMVSQQTRAGDLTHRFPVRIQQLEKTYDLLSLTADQLIDLLGDEFQSSVEASK